MLRATSLRTSGVKTPEFADLFGTAALPCVRGKSRALPRAVYEMACSFPHPGRTERFWIGRRGKSLFLLLPFLTVFFPHRHHSVPGRLQLLRIANTIEVQGKPAGLRRHSSDKPIVRWQRRSTGLACRGNDLRKVHRVHAAASERLMLIPQKPETVPRIPHVIGGDYRPLPCVVQCWLLAIPK